MSYWPSYPLVILLSFISNIVSINIILFKLLLYTSYNPPPLFYLVSIIFLVKGTDHVISTLQQSFLSDLRFFVESPVNIHYFLLSLGFYFYLFLTCSISEKKFRHNVFELTKFLSSWLSMTTPSIFLK